MVRDSWGTPYNAKVATSLFRIRAYRFVRFSENYEFICTAYFKHYILLSEFELRTLGSTQSLKSSVVLLLG